MSPTSTFKTSPIRSSVSSVGFQGFVSKLLINDWLSPAFSARALPEMRCRFRSRIRSRTTSAQISSRIRSFDTPLVVNDNELDCVYHYNDNERHGDLLRILLRKLKSVRALKDSGVMDRITQRRKPCFGEIEPSSETKQQIFEKVARRMNEMSVGDSPPVVCAELNPDVIVISADQSFLFEPQNLRATEWLHRYFGIDNLQVRERIRIHPSQRQRMISELKAAGFEVT